MFSVFDSDQFHVRPFSPSEKLASDFPARMAVSDPPQAKYGLHFLLPLPKLPPCPFALPLITPEWCLQGLSMPPLARRLSIPASFGPSGFLPVPHPFSSGPISTAFRVPPCLPFLFTATSHLLKGATNLPAKRPRFPCEFPYVLTRNSFCRRYPFGNLPFGRRELWETASERLSGLLTGRPREKTHVYLSLYGMQSSNPSQSFFREPFLSYPGRLAYTLPSPAGSLLLPSKRDSLIPSKRKRTFSPPPLLIVCALSFDRFERLGDSPIPHVRWTLTVIEGSLGFLAPLRERLSLFLSAFLVIQPPTGL